MKYQSPYSTYTQRIIAVLSSSITFKFIIGFFVFQSIWIALTGLYPMAFDEEFHLGIIKLYAHHLSPFWSSQPDGANAFGAVFRDPSYLYHYLMSFPYRILNLLTSYQTFQIIWLRLINIGLFTTGLIVFKKVLANIKASNAIINATILIFILLPVTPLLAAQINYDNLFFLMTGLALLFTLKVSKQLAISKKFPLKELFILLSIILLNSIVKYAFLPIFLAIVVYLIFRFKATFTSFGQLFSASKESWMAMSLLLRSGLVILFVASLGLFSQRYISNIYLYRTPVPDCGKVLDVESCSHYGPWIRDYNLQTTKTSGSANAAVFSSKWIYGMWFRLFFSVDGPTTHFETRGALLFPALTSIIVSLPGVFLLLKYFRITLRKYDRDSVWLFVIVPVTYISILWFDQFKAYSRTGQPVAINGRYLLPVLLPIMLLMALAFSQALKANSKLKSVFVSVAIIGMLWGGGAMTYIIRSNDNGSWWWPNRYTRTINRAVKSVLHPVMPGFYDYGQFGR